ncbi:interferon-induced, double-stranded RNA-activated protein kinase-like [Lolium rigidum]|uniref:interferon-induced, double-stranded RNA-activated protein kinase-like n=1 Tax=Lolium rigidum TaxID=89674 RepID=UPI001F5CB08E|nr:interferon-induced, double-stranded RNA-activated protein kinase-like [Lolium rigidum]
MSIHLHPMEDRAAVRVYTIAGARKKWRTIGFYTICRIILKDNLPSFSTEQLFGTQVVQFSVRRCEELLFPPFHLKFKQDFNSLKRLGKGTEGEVFKCSSNFAEYVCAVKKVVPSDLMITSTNFEPSDVTILSELNHPNIVKLHLCWNELGKDYFGRPAEVTFTSMLLCDRTLSTFLKENSRIELDTANDIFRQMMMGLQHAHQHHIVHHDLKPDNILVDDNQRIMISDFGTAKKKESPNSMLQPGVIGSLPYSAPEVTNFHESHDEKADIFSAGIICYELYIPTVAHREQKVKEMSRRIRQAMALCPPWIDFDLDSALDGTNLLDEWTGDYSLLKLMLKPNGSERPSASDILARLPGHTA